MIVLHKFVRLLAVLTYTLLAIQSHKTIVKALWPHKPQTFLSSSTVKMSISGEADNDLRGSQRPPDDTEIDLGLNQDEFSEKNKSDSPKKRKRSESPSSESSTSESSSSSSSDESFSSAAKKKRSAKKKKKTKKTEAEKQPTVISCKVLRH